MSSPALHAVIFLASLQEILDEAAAADAIRASREQLLRDRLTGMVILSEMQILRFIEGEQESVYRDLSRAIDGPYFKNLQILFDGTITQRYFSDYSFYNPIHNNLSDFNTSSMKHFLFQCLDVESPEMKIVRNFL